MEKKSYSIDVGEAGERLDLFLKNREPAFSRSQIKDSIVSGAVLVNGRVVKASHKLKDAESVVWRLPSLEAPPLLKEKIPLDLIFEDEDLIVLNKQSGIVVHPGAGNLTHTLVNALLYHTDKLSSIDPKRPGIVHRLDKETSGLMVVAKNNCSHQRLAKQFKKHSIERRYIALVAGMVAFEEGSINVAIRRHLRNRKKMAVSFAPEAKAASSFYRVLKRYPAGKGAGFTVLELMPQTGRTHQLRVHLSHLGHPVLGDRLYGGDKDFPRLALHAKDLGFQHPTSGERLNFTSALPEVMREAAVGLII